MRSTKSKPIQKPLLSEGFQFDPATHTYTFDGKPMTGVTTLLGVIAKPALIQWAANEAVKYLNHKLLDEHHLSSLEELAEKWPSWAEEARTAHARKRDDAAEKGTDLHALVEEFVEESLEKTGGWAVKYSPIAPEKYEAIQKFIDWGVSNNIRFIASEQKLYSKELWVAGTADLIFEKDGKRIVGDIKTYAKIWDRVPFFQCAGYSIMWEEMNGSNPAMLLTEEEWQNEKIDGYCVLRLGKDGSFEDLWSFDVEGDRKAFLACVELYRQLQAFKQSYGTTHH